MVFPMLTNALVETLPVGPVLDTASGLSGVWWRCLAEQSNLRSSCLH